ncbi:MAG: hypothetical protein H0X16_06845 [Chloroflexi bacterium]|nr:hypothetical protein [Chloroflexota bacterium]
MTALLRQRAFEMASRSPRRSPSSIRGGGLACFWNVRDVDASPLLAEYDELAPMVGAERCGLRRPGPRAETRTEILASGLFDEPVFEQVRHEVPMTGEEFIGLAFTTSHVRMAPPALQAQFRRELERVLAQHGVLATAQVTVPYVSTAGSRDATRTRRPPRMA